eukprot:Rhum_TRINITY_DN14524_c3_g1::Rhum_TRINITY_DN14524_c3_g1_i1::g.96636::m.96636
MGDIGTDVIRSVSKWASLSPAEQHAFASDSRRCAQALRLLAKRDSHTLASRPQVLLLGGCPLPSPPPPPPGVAAPSASALSADAVRRLVCADGVMRLVRARAALSGLRVAGAGSGSGGNHVAAALQAGVAEHVRRQVAAAHYAASRRWGAAAAAEGRRQRRRAWDAVAVDSHDGETAQRRLRLARGHKGLSALLECAEEWCGGVVTPGLRRLSQVLPAAAEEVPQQAAPPRSEQPAATPTVRPVPCHADDMERYLRLQMRAAAWRRDAVDQIDRDAPVRSEALGAMRKRGFGAVDLLGELPDVHGLCADKAHPIWGYVYASYQLFLQEAEERRVNEAEEAAMAEQRKRVEAKRAENEKALREKNSAKALGLKRGLALRFVRQVGVADIENGAWVL